MPEPTNRTYTIWSNAGRYEWLVRDDERVVARSGLRYSSYSQAKRAMLRVLSKPADFND